MDTSGLTHDEKLIFAEVTAALNEITTKEYTELKLEYDAGVLDPTATIKGPWLINSDELCA